MAKKIATILNNQNYQIKTSFWIDLDGSRCFGKGKMQLLEWIEKTGSINKAAKQMNMSYKKAWTMIAELNQQFAKPMVVTQSGGKEGGGTELTDDAKQLMKYYIELNQRIDQFTTSETEQFLGSFLEKLK